MFSCKSHDRCTIDTQIENAGFRFLEMPDDVGPDVARGRELRGDGSVPGGGDGGEEGGGAGRHPLLLHRGSRLRVLWYFIFYIHVHFFLSSK